jgi:hypothetical protein
VLYASVTGTSKRLATSLVQACEKAAAAQAAAAAAAGGGGESRRQLQLQDLASYEVEALLGEQLVLLVLPTHQGGTPPPAAAWFCRCAVPLQLQRAAASLLCASPPLFPARCTPSCCPAPALRHAGG